VGRFISTDQIGFEAGDPNLYRYVFNNSTTYTDPSGEIIPLLLGAALIGGLFGGAYGVAEHIENGGRLDNINWGDIGGKAAFGAFAGAFATAGLIGAAGLAITAGVAVSTAEATALVIGAGATGWGFGSGAYNIATGKPLTGTLDIIGAGLGLKGLKSGYKSYKDTVFNEKIDQLAKDTRATISSIEDWQARNNLEPVQDKGINPAIKNRDDIQFSGGGRDYEYSNWVEDLSGYTGRTTQRGNQILRAAIKQYLPNLKLRAQPEFNPNSQTPGVSKGLRSQIGKDSLGSRDGLVDTIVHEELHVRWRERDISSFHHNPNRNGITYDNGLKYKDMKFYATIARYKKMRGMDYSQKHIDEWNSYVRASSEGKIKVIENHW
jgi:hypothetical protein